MDWVDWHTPYDDPDSSLSHRLRAVQRGVRAYLDTIADRPVRIVSACAGQGRDLLEVLATHPARDRVTARLVELDPANARTARAAAAGLTGIEVVEADAGTTDSYAGAVPADLVMFCGVFGNISDADIERTIRALPSFCAPAATVIWTRGQWDPEVVTSIRGWFDEAGFAEQSFESPPGAKWSVGVDLLKTTPRELEPGTRLFTFTR